MGEALTLIGFVLIAMWVFAYLGNRNLGKSKKRSYANAGKHVSKQGPGIVIYIAVVFIFIAIMGMIFG